MPLPGSHREPQFLQEIKEPVHETPNLNSMTKAKIIEYANSMGVEVDIKMKKAELIQELTQ